MSQGNRVDEGLIHAWLDGQLPPDEAARVERLVATDVAWSDAVAEARGLVAGASRVLGALDHVSSTRSTRSTSGASGARVTRSWARATWLRAAAVLVFVAGVGGVVAREVRNDSQGVASLVESRGSEPVSQPTSDSFRRSSTAPVAEPRDQAFGKVAARESDAKKAEVGNAAGEQRSTNETKGAPPPEAAPPPVAAQAAVTGIAGGAAGRAGADAAGGRAGDARADSSGLARSVIVTGPGTGAGIGSGIAGGGGGRGGRGARSDDAAAEQAKSLADASAIDPRLAGCWLRVDSAALRTAARQERERAAPMRIDTLLRFIGPVVTDVVTLASPLPATAQALARVNSPPVPIVEQGVIGSSLVIPPVSINATVIRGADSSFNAEWYEPRGRTVIEFRVSGDTLRGTARPIVVQPPAAGAARALAARSAAASPAPTPFLATRVDCPR